MLAVSGALVLVALGIGAVAGRFTAPRPPKPAPSVVVVQPTPNVITAIRDLSQLVTSEYHVERVIDLSEKQQRLFGLMEAKDAILLVAVGQVTAGVDLSELRDGDVRADPIKSVVSVTLPPPRILSSRLDNERTYVHSRSTDLLAARKESLETRARQEAERSVVEAAKESGVLERARAGARKAVESLVRSLGYQQVTVKFRDEPPP